MFSSALAFLIAWNVGSADASNLVPQTALPGACIPQFAVPMPVFGPAGPIPRVDALKHPALTVTMKEIDQQVLTGLTDTCNLGLTFGPTRVWAYETSDSLTKKILGPANWPAVTVDARRYVPTLVTYNNRLPQFGEPITINGAPTSGLVQGLVTVDQTIDWADPLGVAVANGCTMFPQLNPLAPACNVPYQGPPAAVGHLHGGEVSSKFDGGPLAWFTPNGLTGKDYNSLFRVGAGKAAYLYENFQEPGTLWFHDHAMGQTRTNVYSGMAAFYLLRDPSSEPKNLPRGAFEIEMAFQDRQFDTNGQLYFPDGSDPLCGSGLPNDPCLNGPPPNPASHPFWIPEFVGDVAIVNGAPWPVLNVEPRRYRFRLLGGANARMFNLDFGGAPIYVIGSDDNYLDKPAKVNKVFIASGERYDVIVDFTNLKGQTITVTNDAPVPFPSGLFPVPHTDPATGATLPADQPQLAQIMQLRVANQASSADKSCNPAIIGDCTRPKPLVRLADGQGNVANGVKIDKVRQLILKEFEGPGGPMMVFVNNTQFMGQMSPGVDPTIFPDGVTELPEVGATELWEITNLTMDAHPMHTHLVQFQVLTRESIDMDGTMGSGIPGGYSGAWESAFPAATSFSHMCTGGVFCPGYGPPLPYNVPNADGALGGNPAIGPYLLHDAAPPKPEESGWKDTAKAYPGQVMRMLVRWTPTSTPVANNYSYAGQNFFPFDPTDGPGYVWHCHIIDHEDNDMMRPYRVTN